MTKKYFNETPNFSYTYGDSIENDGIIRIYILVILYTHFDFPYIDLCPGF